MIRLPGLGRAGSTYPIKLAGVVSKGGLLIGLVEYLGLLGGQGGRWTEMALPGG
jgi:hypothetical protein